MRAPLTLQETELLDHVLSLISGELIVADAEGRLRDPRCAADSTESHSSTERGSIFEKYGGTPEADAELRRVLSGAADESAYTVVRAHRVCDVRVRLLRDEQGRGAGIVGVATDATQRLKRERELAIREARASQMVDSNMIGVLFWERQGAVIGANDALLQLLGYSRAELAANAIDWRAITPPEYLPLDEAALREIDERGVCTPFEKEYIRKDGRRVPVLLGGASVDREHESGVCFVLDQSERKAQEKHRLAAEAQLRHAVNSAPFVLWAVDGAGVFTLSEGRGLAALGLRPGEVVGTSAFEFYKGVPKILDGLRKALSGEPSAETVELNGRIFETRTFRRADVDGGDGGIVGLSLDVTERQRAEAERMKLQAKLLEVQRLESLGLMAGGIAHDFNNILTVIMGNASNALSLASEASELREELVAVVTAAQRAADLTRQMLAYSGRANFDVRRLDVSAEVRELAPLVATTIPSKVQLDLDLGQIPPVSADRAQLQQVIMNLVINAAEAIGEAPGRVVITTSEHLEGIRARGLAADQDLPSGRYVVLEVRDTGRGMDSDTQKRIFDPFFTTKFTGRGLGLAAVLGVIRAHKGAIHVDSAPGEGSTFKVFLPSCEGAAERRRPPPQAYASTGVVLVIDDDAAVRQTLQKMLSACGFSVLEAGDGPSGARATAEHGADLILVLLDMTMPGMDGGETFRAIRELSPVPVLLMSGYGELEAMRRFESSGVAGFLQKPFSFLELSEKLGQILPPTAR